LFGAELWGGSDEKENGTGRNAGFPHQWGILAMLHDPPGIFSMSREG